MINPSIVSSDTVIVNVLRPDINPLVIDSGNSEVKSLPPQGATKFPLRSMVLPLSLVHSPVICAVEGSRPARLNCVSKVTVPTVFSASA